MVSKLLKSDVKRRRGFSLIEVMSGVAILGILSLASINLFLTSISGSTKDNVIREIKQNGDYVVTKMENEIRSARRMVNCSLAMDNLTYQDLNGNVIAWTVDEDGKLLVGEDEITANNVEITTSGGVSSFVVDCVQDQVSQSTTLKVRFALNRRVTAFSKANEQFQSSFEATVTLRNK